MRIVAYSSKKSLSNKHPVLTNSILPKTIPGFIISSVTSSILVTITTSVTGSISVTISVTCSVTTEVEVETSKLTSYASFKGGGVGISLGGCNSGFSRQQTNWAFGLKAAPRPEQ